jgi:hypothetical protein
MRTCAAALPADPELSAFARDLVRQIPAQLLVAEQDRLQARQDELAFSTGLESKLGRQSHLHILRFAVSQRVLWHVTSHLGVIPRLKGYIVMLNIPHPELDRAEGSKAWHRDGGEGGYKSMRVFMCLSEVDAESGPYQAVHAEHLPFFARIPVPFRPGDNAWTGGRLTPEELFAYVSPSAVRELAGAPGTVAFVNACAVYHKGGHCRTKPRLMLELIYATDAPYDDDSLALEERVDLERPDLLELLSNPIHRFVLGVDERPWSPFPRLMRRLDRLHAALMSYEPPRLDETE